MGSMLVSMLGSMLVSSSQGLGEVTMGKVPWGSMLGCMLVSSFQGMGEVTMGKVRWGVHVAFHVGFHVGFQLSGYGGGHHGKGTMGAHVGFHGRSVLYSWQLIFLEKVS